MPKDKFAFVFGTRPEIIKLSPVIKLCQRRKIPFICIHTGQHFTKQMDQIFLKELKLPKPKYTLGIRSAAAFRQGHHTGRMLIKLEDILLREKPSCVITQGDTNSAMAGSLVASKITTTKDFSGLCIYSAHVESGLRSFDRSMPEEINRILADHIADFLFAPTTDEKKRLLKEGIPRERIFVTGNTIVDALKQASKDSNKRSSILKRLRLTKKGYILLTLHRQENVDNKRIFLNILQGFKALKKLTCFPIVFAIHPRTKRLIKKNNIKLPANVKIIPPCGYLDFIQLEAHAALIMTDSGGIQEEACTLRVPCVTLRDNTERPQSVKVGANVIAGRKPASIVKAFKKMIKKKRVWPNPFGTGKSAEQILKVLLKKVRSA